MGMSDEHYRRVGGGQRWGRATSGASGGGSGCTSGVGSGDGSGAGSGPSALGPETTSGQLGDYDQSPAGELEEECQAIREGEEAVTHWDLVSEHSHSNLETEKRAAAAAGRRRRNGQGGALSRGRCWP